MGALELGMLAGDASVLPPRRRRSLVDGPPLRHHCRRTPLAATSLSTFSRATRTSILVLGTPLRSGCSSSSPLDPDALLSNPIYSKRKIFFHPLMPIASGKCHLPAHGLAPMFFSYCTKLQKDTKPFLSVNLIGHKLTILHTQSVIIILPLSCFLRKVASMLLKSG